jgi:hypothetical protein
VFSISKILPAVALLTLSATFVQSLWHHAEHAELVQCVTTLCNQQETSDDCCANTPADEKQHGQEQTPAHGCHHICNHTVIGDVLLCESLFQPPLLKSRRFHPRSSLFKDGPVEEIEHPPQLS